MSILPPEKAPYLGRSKNMWSFLLPKWKLTHRYPPQLAPCTGPSSVLVLNVLIPFERRSSVADAQRSMSVAHPHPRRRRYPPLIGYEHFLSKVPPCPLYHIPTHRREIPLSHPPDVIYRLL